MKKKRQKPFHLDMNFDEALKRFGQTDSRELPAAIPKSAKRKKRAAPRKNKSDPQQDEKPPSD
jgi:hypothetical protein